jgi:hypothetical protein
VTDITTIFSKREKGEKLLNGSELQIKGRENRVRLAY